MFGHGFDLLFGEFETVFALFRKFPVFPVQGDGIHCLFWLSNSQLKRLYHINTVSIIIKIVGLTVECRNVIIIQKL